MDLATIENKAVKRTALNLLSTPEHVPQKLIDVLKEVQEIETSQLMSLNYEIGLLTSLITLKIRSLGERDVMTNDELKVINNMTKTLTTAKIEHAKAAKEDTLNLIEMKEIIKQIISIVESNVPPQAINVIRAAVLQNVIIPRKEGLSDGNIKKLEDFSKEIESKVLEATTFDSAEDIKKAKENGSGYNNNNSQ